MRSNYQLWWESVKSLNCMICNYGWYTIQGKGNTFMELSGHLMKEMANFEIRIWVVHKVSTSSLLVIKLRIMCFLKIRFMCFLKARFMCLLKGKQSCRHQLFNHQAWKVFLTILLLSVEQITVLQCLSCDWHCNVFCKGKTERWVIRWTHPLLTISAKTTIRKLKKN